MLNKVFQPEHTNIQLLIQESKITKKDIAKGMNISVQWLNKLLKRDINDWTIGELRSFLHTIGYKLELNIRSIEDIANYNSLIINS